jgi:hypothetical protein
MGAGDDERREGWKCTSRGSGGREGSSGRREEAREVLATQYVEKWWDKYL